MEREHKKKQEALTLEETKQQIQFFETKLTQLKEEKHQHIKYKFSLSSLRLSNHGI